MDENRLEGLVRTVALLPADGESKTGKERFYPEVDRCPGKPVKVVAGSYKEYPMNWFYCFETVPGKDEYYITHKQCGICKLTKQENCHEITKYLA